MDINLTTSPDFSALAAIHAASFDFPWDTKSFASLFATEGTLAFVAQDNAGFSMLRIIADEAEILTLAVLPQQRRQGIADNLVRHMLGITEKKHVTSLFLEVRKSNTAAINLYNKHGFQLLSQRREYYTNPDGSREDAIVMKKGL